MDWLEILQQIFEVCIIPLLGVLVGILIKWIESKRQDIISKTNNEMIIKYTNILSEVIISCVSATNQTYVDALKAKGKFDAEAQKAAFDKTFNAVIDILSTEAIVCLTEAYGDINEYIKNKIELEVRYNK